jgi:Na+/phosphate symporter
MKEKHIFVNPFRIISPKLDTEASRLEEIYEPPPEEVTRLEEGLLVMCSKLIEMTTLIYKCLIIADPDKFERCEQLGQEIHVEEKSLTADLVHNPKSAFEVLKTVILFPGRLERAGDLLESILNVARIRARDGIPFSDKAQEELTRLFGLMTKVLTDFRSVLTHRDRRMLGRLMEAHKQLGQMTIDFALAHEDRLIDGLCSPKASSLYLDILDSVKNTNLNIRSMTESLIKIADEEASASA